MTSCLRCVAKLLRSSLLLLFLAVEATPTFAEGTPLLHEVAARLQFRSGVEGNFQQKKQLPFMSAPLVSRGEFSLSPEGGLHWQVSEPVTSLMTVRGSVVTLDGQAVQDNGVGRLMARLMGAFSTGDLSGIAEDFSVQGNASDDPWTLVLTPRGLLLGRALSQVKVAGGAFLQRIEVVEQGGATTLIEFSNVTPLNGERSDSGELDGQAN